MAKPSEPRHPDLLTTEQAARRMGAPGTRLDKLPPEFRPAPLPYNRQLFHREAVDEAILRAARQANPQLNIARR